MRNIVFVTGNQRKVDYLSELLGFEIKHHALDLDEIQSADVEEVAAHKAKQAYMKLGQPVMIEDVSLEFDALNGLPGPFIKFFVQGDAGLEACCRMLDGFTSRRATARSVFALYDGNELTVLKGSLSGVIADHPKGNDGWDWDHIFCPDGYEGRSRAELTKDEDITTYLTIKPIDALRDLLRESDGN